MGQSAHRPNPISPRNGGRSPEQKLNLSGSLGPKSTRVRRGKGVPQGGELEKVTRPQKLELNFLEKKSIIFFKFQTSKGSPVTMIFIRQIPPPIPGRGTTEKNEKNLRWGPGPQI